MGTRQWNLQDKLPFLRPQSKEDKLKKIEADLAKAESLQKVLTSKDWPLVRGILNALKEQAVIDISQRGIVSKDMERLNHRLELLKDIDTVFDSIMKRGKEALIAFDKLKEKPNDRASN